MTSDITEEQKACIARMDIILSSIDAHKADELRTLFAHLLLTLKEGSI